MLKRLRRILTARTSGPGPELPVRIGTSGQPPEVRTEMRDTPQGTTVLTSGPGPELPVSHRK